MKNPIKKHIQAFRKFCLLNKNALLSKNLNNLIEHRIIYSERVFINVKYLYKRANIQEKDSIVKHLLTISAFVDPSSNAKEVLKETMKNNSDNTTEDEFLGQIIDTVEENLDPTANPMEMVSSMLSSGTFTGLIGNMNDGLNSW